MNRITHPFFAVSSIALALFAFPAAQATTLDFNALGPTTLGSNVPAGHGGFDWGNQWFYLTQASAPGQTFLATSTVGSTLIRRSDGADFQFIGADFWSRRGADAVGDFFFVLYHNGATVYNGNLLGNDGRMRFSDAPSFLTPSYSGLIDAMAFGFDNDDFDHLAMDNFQFRMPAGAPTIPTVAEPATGAVLAAGLALLGWTGQRRRARTD